VNRKTQRAAILRLLVEARNSWVPLPEIMALEIAQYNARIFELRRLGFTIENRTETDPRTGSRQSWFRLVGELPAVTPKPSRFDAAHCADLEREAPLFARGTA
jgi:hypothetical protein